MRISDFSITAAALCALGGMAMGIVMGANEDFTLAPAHAHLNLLGWVTLALYGLYHRSAGRESGLVGWLQVGSGTAGALVMTAGLAGYLAIGDQVFVPVIMAGSLLAVIGMLLFVGLVLGDARKTARSTRHRSVAAK